MGRAWTTGAALAAVAMLAGCAGGKAQQMPDQVGERTMQGNLEFVDSRSLMVSDSGNPDQPARLLSRGDRVSVIQDGHEVGWDQLSEGDQVRVTYTDRMAGPSEIARVEILSAEGDSGDRMTEPPYPPAGVGPSMPGEPEAAPPDVPTTETPEPVPGTPR